MSDPANHPTQPPAADAPTALIAEDEPLLAAALKAELQREWPALKLVAEAGSGTQALAQALQQRPDLCFLDIRMPGMSGLEAAQALAEDWPDDGRPLPLLVFVTAYDQYALRAFEAQAVDYLVKPVEPARLKACVQRLQARLAERRAVGGAADAGVQAGVHTGSVSGPAQAADTVSGASAPTAPAAPVALQLDHTLAQLRALLGAGALGAATPAMPRLSVIQAQVGQTVHLVPIDEVLYFEAADKYIRVVTAEREHLIRLSLKELLPQLDEQLFWQVHRSLVVRASAIATAQRDESGKVFLQLKARPERLTASRLYAHRFKGL